MLKLWLQTFWFNNRLINCRSLKGSFKKYVCWGGGGGSLKREQERTGGGGPSMSKRALFIKILRFSKGSFIVILQFFLLIQYEILNKPSLKIMIFSPVNEWRLIAWSPAHTRSPIWVMLKNLFTASCSWLNTNVKVWYCSIWVTFFSGVSFGDHGNGWIGKIYLWP